jgi:ribosomal protein S18 acetylase RimI-like enzyme
MLPVDAPQLLRLLVQDRPGIAGLSSTRAYRSVISDCLHSRNLFCIVAARDQGVLGYVLAVRNWSRFQKWFGLRHPWLAMQALAKKLGSRSFRANAGPAPGHVPPSRPESNARILYIGVDGTQRSRGIGAGLYAALRAQLANEGVEQVQAHIAQQNLPSLRLHERTGWSISRRREGGFMAIMNVRDEA